MKQVPAAVVEILIKKSQFTLNWDLVPLNPKIEFWTALDSFDYPSLPPPPPPPQLQGDLMWRLISVSPVDTIFVSLIIPNMVSTFPFRSQHFLSGFSTPLSDLSILPLHLSGFHDFLSGVNISSLLTKSLPIFKITSVV